MARKYSSKSVSKSMHENNLTQEVLNEINQSQTTQNNSSEIEAKNSLPKMPTKIHLIDGEKGGVGKSLFTRTMMHYCTTTSKAVILVDADSTNPDVAEVYAGGKQIAFSEDERKSYAVDEIFDLAFEQSVIVNLPAQMYPLVSNWIDRNNLIQVGKQHSIQFVKWFICSGAYDSVRLFVESVQKFQADIIHVLVENHGLCDEWTQVYERPQLKELIKEYDIQTVKFPKLSYRERDRILENKLTFAVACLDKEMKILGQQRVVNFLKEATQAIEKTQLIV